MGKSGTVPESVGGKDEAQSRVFANNVDGLIESVIKWISGHGYTAKGIGSIGVNRAPECGCGCTVDLIIHGRSFAEWEMNGQTISLEGRARFG